jgi:glycosyltransferase involved in cell wall biosynthesis
MRKPLISIVMPTLNSERFIREALNSVVEQTYENIELVVVDGGSTDRTLEILKEYGRGGIKLIESVPGKGISHDLNLGLAHAEGSFIARLDADDIALDWRIDAQYKFLSTHSDVDVVGSGAELFWNASGECRSPLWHDHIRDMYLVNNPFFHPTVMFRRHLFDSGLLRYDEKLSSDEDYELWGRLISSAKAANMDCSTIKYRIHETNNQRNPTKIHNKTIALERFCRTEGIYSAPLVDALAEFQVSSFITPTTYNILSIYARTAVANDAIAEQPWPKLGWIQWALTDKSNYEEFMVWYTQAKGWKLGA